MLTMPKGAASLNESGVKGKSMRLIPGPKHIIERQMLPSGNHDPPISGPDANLLHITNVSSPQAGIKAPA